MSSAIAPAFRSLQAPGSERRAIQLTQGPGHCYPLYYFIPTVSADGGRLVFHRAWDGQVQLFVLDLASGEERQLSHGDTPETGWLPWDGEHGRGVLDHRSVLNVAREEVYFVDRGAFWSVALDGGEPRQLFRLPDGRAAIGQNCVSPDGTRLIYISADAEQQRDVLEHRQRHRSKGTELRCFSLDNGDDRLLVRINSPIHHVLPVGDEHLLFCHPTNENGMLLTDYRGGWYTHMRTQDELGGMVCHHITNARGIDYEVLGRPDGVWAGRYDPHSQDRFEWPLPSRFRYTHTGNDPAGRLSFFETMGTDGAHELWFLRALRTDGDDQWEKLAGDWPTFGSGQQSHFHPQVMPDRRHVLLVAGDAAEAQNQIFLLDIADLPDTQGIGALTR